jgi:ferritin-like protein
LANSVGYHEENLPESTKDMHRALTSLMEELEAVDWYQQRVDATNDPDLKQILAHNRDEEKEHAAMALEWIRRRDAKWDKVLRQYLFTEGNLIDIEHGAEFPQEHGDGANGNPPTRTTIGSLKGVS